MASHLKPTYTLAWRFWRCKSTYGENFMHAGDDLRERNIRHARQTHTANIGHWLCQGCKFLVVGLTIWSVPKNSFGRLSSVIAVGWSAETKPPHNAWHNLFHLRIFLFFFLVGCAGESEKCLCLEGQSRNSSNLPLLLFENPCSSHETLFSGENTKVCQVLAPCIVRFATCVEPLPWASPVCQNTAFDPAMSCCKIATRR